jgi:hypothetical protein
LALYAEPLYTERHIRMIKYFLKLNTGKNDNCILGTILCRKIYDVDVVNCSTNWASKLKSILQSAKFSEVWLYPDSVNIKLFVPIFRNRLRDIYICCWNDGIQSSSLLDAKLDCPQTNLISS